MTIDYPSPPDPAQPEPEVVGPTDEELDELFADQSGEALSWRAFARAVLARWGRPAPAPAGERQAAPVPVFPEDAQVIEPTQRTILVPAPVPVALAERPWEREGWCDEDGRCWWFDPKDPGWVLDDATTCRHWSDFSLPHNALPLPDPSSTL